MQLIRFLFEYFSQKKFWFHRNWKVCINVDNPKSVIVRTQRQDRCYIDVWFKSVRWVLWVKTEVILPKLRTKLLILIQSTPKIITQLHFVPKNFSLIFWKEELSFQKCFRTNSISVFHQICGYKLKQKILKAPRVQQCQFSIANEPKPSQTSALKAKHHESKNRLSIILTSNRSKLLRKRVCKLLFTEQALPPFNDIKNQAFFCMMFLSVTIPNPMNPTANIPQKTFPLT